MKKILLQTAGIMPVFFILNAVFIATIMPPEKVGMLFNIFGVIIGIFLCPVFLPTPSFQFGQDKKRMYSALIFISLVFLPSIVIRFMGVEIQSRFPLIRIFLGVISGIFIPLCYGLFFLTRNNVRKLSSLWLAFALMGAVAVRQLITYLMNLTGIASDPQRTVVFLWNILKWSITGAGISALLCVFLLYKFASDRQDDAASSQQTGTNTLMIFRFLGLILLFGTLRSFMELWLYPEASGVQDTFGYFFPVTVPVVLALAFAAGKPGFLRLFLLPFIILIIMFPCLFFIHEYPLLVIIGNFVYIMYHTIWSVFPALIIENYKGHFWFYACAGVTTSVINLSFTYGKIAGSLIPFNIVNMTLITTVSAALFFLLVFRILFSVSQKEQIPLPQTNVPAPSRAENFSSHNLTERQTEVAALILQGLENKAIAEKLFLSERTVKKYAGIIFEKYKVKRRSEFIAKFYQS